MIERLDDKIPKIAASAFISKAAYVVGDVAIGENSSIWPGTTIRADYAPVRIGDDTNIQDNCALHADGLPDDPSVGMVIGNGVTIGHGAVVHCLKIGDRVLVGMNATLLQQAEIGDDCVIAAGTLVSPGMKIPAGSLAVGVPAKITGKPSKEHKEAVKYASEHYRRLAQRYKSQGL